MEHVEGAINDVVLCHPDDPGLPDCYSIVSYTLANEQEFKEAMGETR